MNENNAGLCSFFLLFLFCFFFFWIGELFFLVFFGFTLAISLQYVRFIGFYFVSSLRAVDGASPKLIMSRGFHTGDPTIKKNKKEARLDNVCMCLVLI